MYAVVLLNTRRLPYIYFRLQSKIGTTSEYRLRNFWNFRGVTCISDQTILLQPPLAHKWEK